jgi:hypothetical protein
MPVLHRQSDEFDDRNLFLQVVLGLLSLAERVDAAVARAAPEPVATDAAGVTNGAPHPMDLALLGAIATGRRLREQLAGAAPMPPAAPPPTVAHTPPPGPETLRRLLI